MDVVLHANPAQAHQLEHAEWWRAGLARHGLGLTVTADRARPGDVHIVSGPHYALRHWAHHPRVVWLDRCFYRRGARPPDMVSMPDVSLGWLRAHGGREFCAGSGRTAPPVEACSGQGSIFLADYRGPVEAADTVRRHPLDERHAEPLEVVLRRHRRAIGYGTTALVTAGLLGLEVECRDPRHIMARPDWLACLPYADWHYSEIISGEAWEHLCRSL